MRIMIEYYEGRSFRLLFPTGWVCNRLTASFAPKFMKQNGVEITKQQALSLFQELNRCRRRHPEWVLIEAESADGAHIKIKL